MFNNNFVNSEVVIIFNKGPNQRRIPIGKYQTMSDEDYHILYKKKFDDGNFKIAFERIFKYAPYGITNVGHHINLNEKIDTIHFLIINEINKHQVEVQLYPKINGGKRAKKSKTAKKAKKAKKSRKNRRKSCRR